jgi:hypothetical protein
MPQGALEFVGTHAALSEGDEMFYAICRRWENLHRVICDIFVLIRGM